MCIRDRPAGAGTGPQAHAEARARALVGRRVLRFFPNGTTHQHRGRTVEGGQWDSGSVTHVKAPDAADPSDEGWCVEVKWDDGTPSCTLTVDEVMPDILDDVDGRHPGMSTKQKKDWSKLKLVYEDLSTGTLT